MKISDVIKAKASQDVVTIRPEASVGDLLALLSEHNVGALVVSNDGTTLQGIVSERDVVRHLHRDPAVLNSSVAQIININVHTCSAGDPVDDLMQTMTEHRIRHVPVVADGFVTAIISIGDVVKSRIGELEFERDQLDNYLHQS